MKSRHVLAVAVSFLMGGAVLAQAPVGGTSMPRSGLFVDPASDLKWTDLDPKGAPGVKIVDVWGDHAKGAFGAFIQFPAGFAAPLHTHTNDYKIVIVSGTMIQGPEGKPEFRLGP